jgi:surface polysaccharide O-acyltransferase-like enzyme
VKNNGTISSRIEILRFPLIIGIVFIHNYTSTIRMAQGSIGVEHSSAWDDFVRFFISQGVARVAVPLFFLVSGYLFFLGQWSWSKYAGKLKRRVNTLLIPFLFWNLATWAIYTAGRRIPQTRMYFEGGVWPPAGQVSFLGYIGALFGISARYPIDYQFWFIRDLIALVVLAPVIYFLLRGKWLLPFLLILFGLWFAAAWPDLWPSMVHSIFLPEQIEAALYFSLGAYLSQPGKDVTCLDKFGPWISAAFFVFLVLHSTYQDRLPYLHKFVILFGVPSLWWLTGLALGSAKLKASLIGLVGDGFFVFAAHEPLQTVVRKVSYRLFSPTAGASVLALYLLTPVCMIALLVVVRRCLLKIMPRFTGVITGNTYRVGQQRA